MNIEEIKKSEKAFLVPKDVAEVIGCDPYTINIQAKEDKRNGVNSFPFPVLLMGSRVRIPRKPFLKAIGEEE